MLAVIGGSGLYSVEGLVVDDRRLIETEYGPPSGDLITGHLGGDRLLFIARHGEHHSIVPHRINYAAVCPVANRAAGLTDGPLDIDAMGEVLEAALVPLRDLITGLA